MEPAGNGLQRVDVDALTKAGLGPDQPRQLDAQRARQRIGESRQKDARLGVDARQVRRACASDTT